MAVQFTGTCVVRMDGLSLRSGDKAKIEIGGKERTPIYADHEYAGFTEKPMCAKVTLTARHTAETNLIALRDAKNVSIEFETDTGISFLVAGAALAKPPELSSGEGDIELEFIGAKAVQR